MGRVAWAVLMFALWVRESRCRWGFHDWRTTMHPEPMYQGVSSWAGTKRCRRCQDFRYWTSLETAIYERSTPWKHW